MKPPHLSTFQSVQWFPIVSACHLLVFSTECKALAILAMSVTPLVSLLQTVVLGQWSRRACGPRADVPEWRFTPLSCTHPWSGLRMDGIRRAAQCRSAQSQSAAVFVCLFIQSVFYFYFNQIELKLKCRVLLFLCSWWAFKRGKKPSGHFLPFGCECHFSSRELRHRPPLLASLIFKFFFS